MSATMMNEVYTAVPMTSSCLYQDACSMHTSSEPLLSKNEAGKRRGRPPITTSTVYTTTDHSAVAREDSSQGVVASCNVPACSLLLGIIIGCYIECSAVLGRGIVSAVWGTSGDEQDRATPAAAVVAFLVAWNCWTCFCLSVTVTAARMKVEQVRSTSAATGDASKTNNVSWQVEKRFCFGTVIGVVGVSITLDRLLGLGGGVLRNADMWFNIFAFCLCFQYCFGGELKLSRLLIALFESKRPVAVEQVLPSQSAAEDCADLEQGTLLVV